MHKISLVKWLCTALALSGGVCAAQTVLTTAPTPALSAAAARAMASPLSSALSPDAPGRYTIKSGDTLWALANLYLKTPWRWPDLWRMNRTEIKNPHLIYPGQVLVLSYDENGQPRLNFEGSATSADGSAYNSGPRPLVKISPALRYNTIARDNAVPSIPPAELEPFLSRPLVIDAAALEANPQITLTDDKRVILARGDVAYAMSIKEGQPRDWHVYRASGELRDPRYPFKQWFQRSDWYGGKKEADIGLLGYEAMYLGDARVLQYGDIAKIEIVSSKEEISPKDRLIVAPVPERISYVPHAPEKPIESVVIKLNGPLAEAGRGAVVALASGSADGLEIGHVLQFVRPPRLVPNVRYVRPGVFSTFGMVDPAPSQEPEFLKIPEERIGLGFVFRTFERVAYCYVVSSSSMVRVGDLVKNP